MTPALELRHVARSYAEGVGRLDIFKDLALEVYAGEIVALVGQSGAGKSSLLHIAGLLEAPTAGEVFISGQNCTALDDAARTRIRRTASAQPISVPKSPVSSAGSVGTRPS